MSKNLSFLSKRQGLTNNLFEQLGKSAEATGTPSRSDMERLKKEFLMGDANIYGTVSFYDFLKEDNQGKKVYVCNGSSCLTAGTQDHVKGQLLNHFKPEEIGEMCCLGRCHENSSFHYSGKSYSGDAIHQLPEILDTKKVVSDKYQVGSLGTPVISTTIEDNQTYYEQNLSQVFSTDKAQLLKELEISGLRGRGGAGFPTHIKLAACKDMPNPTKFIVCNADEGDPGAYSDRFIMEDRPQTLLTGMIIAGYITGAEWGVVYIRAEYPESIQRIQSELEVLEKLGWIGENIKGSGFTFRFKVIKAQGAYICGEETALLSSIEGQRPEVRVRPPFPAQEGLFRQPTVISNVETLASIPFITKNSGQAYANIGVGRSTGTKLISLDGHFNNPGIYEVDMGTPLKDVIEQLGGGFRVPIKALHIGGPLGGIVPVSKISELNISFESFSSGGFLLGHASVLCIPEDFPIIEYLRHLFQFTSHESCGKCFPCRLGTIRGFELIDKALTSNYTIDTQLFIDLLDTLEAGSLCALGGGLPLPIRNSLQYFEGELKQYFHGSLA
ncbi:MAG: SLBB domain-containing protein [Chitinophagales bacterium]|nr:SLBB domain-containing protein [Chitinophagales bacterium]